jgi:small subunit ribosomal protein S9
MNELKFPILATGRRKTAVARIYLYPGEGKLLINKKTIDEYFGNHQYHKYAVMQPLQLLPEKNKYDIHIKVEGGGITGHAEAIRHGLARAFAQINPEYRYLMRQAGFLTRDPRMVERKKAGRPKARKSFQWTKR